MCNLPFFFFSIHADGKKYDRLPVLVTGLDFEQLLGVPRLDSGTGIAQAEASFQLATEWGIEYKIAALVFDTTATNSGCIKGCCILLEQKLGKKLLHCACRHHVNELVLESAATCLLGDSKDPRLPFFAELENAWPDLNKGECFFSDSC